MAKNKNKNVCCNDKVCEDQPLELSAESEIASESLKSTPADAPQPVQLQAWRRRFFLRTWADLIKVACALVVIFLAIAIWFQPPLMRSDFPYVAYRFQGATARDARLYRPLAMPTRYYVELPQVLAGRYKWFAIDRRREVVTLAEAPTRQVLGWPVIRRGDALGLDLEFRKLDGSEWQVFFLEKAIVFSNAVLSVRLDAQEPGK